MMAVVRQRKRELIEKECAGLIEFIEPRHGLDTVGGNEHIKGELLEIARLIRSGDRARAPMGLLAVGPMGAGKTFVIKAFLKEAGLSGRRAEEFSLQVGRFDRGQPRTRAGDGQGDGADCAGHRRRRPQFRQRGDSDGGTGSRVIARLKEFMSDPENRGQVLFILMTNRPDKLDTDIKRPGRLDRKIPFFYAETPPNGRPSSAPFSGATTWRSNSPTPPCWTPASAGRLFERRSRSRCPARRRIRRTRRARRRRYAAAGAAAASGDAGAAGAGHRRLHATAGNAMVRYMEMLAVAETSRRSLLPQRFRSLSAVEVQDPARRTAASDPTLKEFLMFPLLANVSLDADQTIAATRLLLRIAHVDGAPDRRRGGADPLVLRSLPRRRHLAGFRQRCSRSGPVSSAGPSASRHSATWSSPSASWSPMPTAR
jgi:transitional endoplasmic reticulum ATPase